MKKIFYLASIAALALSSCAKDQTTEAQIDGVKGGSKIVAAMEADDTRTHLDTKDEVKFEYRWSLGDQLGIYGYGENTLSNAAFVLDNASDNSPVGVFTSQHKLDPAQSYVAVYPRFAEPLFHVAETALVVDNTATENDRENDYLEDTDGNSILMKILPEQKYQDKTFYTTTAPAISGSFDVTKNGEAEIGMQPVADYLMVNIRSTEEIKTLTLKLRDRTNGAPEDLLISGTSTLAAYWFNGEYRYYIPEGTATAPASKNVAMPTADAARLTDETITIKTDEAYRTIACHDPNTYVFTIPAGLLGMNKNIEAWIWVNDANITDPAIADVDFIASNVSADTFKKNGVTDLQGIDTNNQMNYAVVDKKVVSRLDADGNIARKLENTVFWMNSISVDTNGDKKADARGSFMYNPNDDAVIEDEAQLLEYFADYANNANKKVFEKDAFLCANATFDFSKENMLKRAAEYEDTDYEEYIANYLANGFPCIDDYHNDFVGNGAKIVNIFKPLQKETGLFGGTRPVPGGHHVEVLTTRAGSEDVSDPEPHTISNVTFSNINAWEHKGDTLYDKNHTPYRVNTLGYILAASFDGDIKNVTVTNSYGEAVMGTGTANQLAGLTVKDAQNLCNVFDILKLNNYVDLTKTWDDLATVNGQLFELIDPEAYEGETSSPTVSDEGDLNVITIAKGDSKTYAKLTSEVLYSDEEINVAAVVIKNVSHWTGGRWNVANTYGAAIENNGTEVGRYIQYAEELAYGHNVAKQSAVLARDLDLNWENLQWYDSYGSPVQIYDWEGAEFNVLDGDGHSISNTTMTVYDWDATSLSAINEVAPFSVNTVQNLKMNNVLIDIWTPAEDRTITVPEYIGGVALGATTVTNVSVNNLNIEAYRSDNSANDEGNYAVARDSKIGWVVAATNGTVKFNTVNVNGVNSNVKGISGVVGAVTVANTTGSAQFISVAAANVNDTVNAAIAKFAKYNTANTGYTKAEGTVVGLVNNNKSGLDLDVEFKKSGAPVFLYSIANTGSEINVNYDEKDYETLKK